VTGKLVLIGSGEVAPGMVGLHRRLLKDLGAEPRAAFLDTPAGFELGLTSIHERFTDYFSRRLGIELRLASFRNSEEPAAVVGAALEAIRRADYLIAGPGSPSYAIRHWRASTVLDAVTQRWHSGATLVFASSAAVAIGRNALPVYEIYKVGEPLHWIPGLDLLGGFGLDLAIVPHWDNAEGGTHDTRACFMGMERFAKLRRMLPPGCVVVGVDEHTACVFDLDAGAADVRGRGGVTILQGDSETVYPSGSTVAIRSLTPTPAPHREGVPAAGTMAEGMAPSSPDVQAAAQVAAGDLAAGLRTLADGAPPDLASVLHMAADQAERQALPAEDPARLIDLLVSARQLLRDAQQWSASDRVRDELAALGIEVRDTPQGPVWERRT
jgi:cyanophycinase-like exopeptidase